MSLILPTYNKEVRATQRADHAEFRRVKEEREREERTQPNTTRTERSFSIGTESSISLGTRGTQLASDGTYLFLSLRNGKGVQIRDLDNPAVVHTTIVPEDFIDGNNDWTITNMSYGGGILAFTTYSKLYAYRFTDHSTFNLAVEHEIPNENMRACYVDSFGEWVYFGGFTGNIYAYDLNSSSVTTYEQFHNGEMRFFYAYNVNLVSVSNDNTIVRLDRTNRNLLTKTQAYNHGNRIEVVWTDSEYTIFGSDSQTIEVTRNDDLTNKIKTINDPSDDVTSVVREFQYLSASTDAGQVFIYDIENDFLRKASVSKSSGAESSLIVGGSWFYITKDATLYYRSYLNN